MRVLVTTSDQYLHLLMPYAILFNRYWPGQQVTMLGFDSADLPTLPNNFEYISLGKQEDFGRFWTDPIIPYIDKIKEDYFVVTCADMLLTDYANLKKIELLEKEISSGSAKKALLNCHLNGYTEKHKDGINKLWQKAPYRTTLNMSIWEKEYFKKYLNPNFTIWDFEIKNMPESQEDGAVIITPDSPKDRLSTDPAEVAKITAPYNPVKTANVYEKGVPFPRWNSSAPWGTTTGIRKEDILLIYNYILRDGAAYA